MSLRAEYGFTNVYNPRAYIERKDEFKNTHVAKGADLGANCTIVCGVRIGKYAFGSRGGNQSRCKGLFIDGWCASETNRLDERIRRTD